MDRESFEKLVSRGIDEIPDAFFQKLDNVSVVVEDYPTRLQLHKLRIKPGHTLLGLYEGIPKTSRWNYGQVLPDKITLFQKPIEQVARTSEDIPHIVADTVKHEIAHHFGMSDEEIHKAQSKRD